MPGSPKTLKSSYYVESVNQTIYQVFVVIVFYASYFKKKND